MTHKPGSEYDFVEWYRESAKVRLRTISGSESVERAKTAAGVALAWTVGLGYLTGKIAEAGVKKTLTVSRKIIDEVVSTGAVIAVDGLEPSVESSLSKRRGSLLTALGVDYETASGNYPFPRTFNLATTSSFDFELVQLEEAQTPQEPIGEK